MKLETITPNLPVMTPREREYVLQQLALAREDAHAAAQRVRVPRPGIAPPAREAIASCYEAAEHLHDVLQVDVSAELVEQVRHAIGELQDAIGTLDRSRRPAGRPVEPPVHSLDRVVDWLTRLEHELRS